MVMVSEVEGDVVAHFTEADQTDLHDIGCFYVF
jgi:hypothetical protein